MNRPLSDDPIRLRKRKTRAEAIEDARKVARVIESHLKGSRDLVRTWADAAEALGCIVKVGRDSRGGPGFYIPKDSTMVYDARYSADVVVRLFAHELAHHVLAQWPGSTYRRGWERYDDDRNTYQHWVADYAEFMLLGEFDQ
jgi:hypothetical protein